MMEDELNKEELCRITKFFEILIDVDKRMKRREQNDKKTSTRTDDSDKRSS